MSRVVKKSTQSAEGFTRARIVAITIVTALIAASGGIAQSAAAAPGDGSEASAQVLSGTLLGRSSLEAIAALRGAQAASAGSVNDVRSSDLAVSALNAIELGVPGGLRIPFSGVDLGVLDQRATANADGSALAVSGAVGSDGMIEVGQPGSSSGPAAFSLGLTPLLSSSTLTTIVDADLQLSALSASARTDGVNAPVGDYDIAGARLQLRSPAVSALPATLRASATTTVNSTIAAVAGPNGLIAGVLRTVTGLTNDSAATSITLTTNLGTTLDPVLSAPLGAGGPIRIDLTTGLIDVDLRALLASDGVDINSLDPNTELLSPRTLLLVQNGVNALLRGLVTQVVTAATQALNNATLAIDVRLGGLIRVTASGTVGAFLGTAGPVPTIGVEVVGATLCPLLGPLLCGGTLPGLLLNGIRGVLSTNVLGTGPTAPLTLLTGTLSTTIIEPALTRLTPALLQVVNGIVSLTANVQDPAPAVAGADFRQTALRFRVLSGPDTMAPVALGAPPAMSLDLASASVGPNVVAGPVVNAISPNRGPVAGGTSVTITGTGFDGATSVTFGGTPGTGVTVASGGETLTVTTPAHAAGPVDVVVTTPSGASQPAQFTYYATTDVVSITPTSGPTAGGTSVTITGTSLTGASAVTFGTRPATSFVVNSATQITAVTPAGTGTVDVTVTVPGEPGSDTLAGAFTYVAPGAAVVTSIAPARGPQSGGTPVTITGSGFSGATGVTFAGVPATGVVVQSSTVIRAVTPPNAPQIAPVSVINPAGPSAPIDFTYYATTDVTGVSPTSGPEAGGTTVTITGTAFAGATSVTFGTAAAASFTVNSDTQITAVTPAGTGAVGVTVSVPGEAGADTLPAAFTYRAAPAVASLTPNRGPIAGGTVVTLSGTDFDGATSVTFDGIAGTAFIVDSPTQITVTTPAHAAGAVPVVITDPDGNSVPVTFTYYATTDATGISPTSGPEAGGTTVTITGTAFTGTTSVTFGTTPAASFTVVSDTQITAVTPAGTGTVGVTVAVPGEAGSDTLADAFTFVAPGAPTIAFVSPNRGPVAGGTAVTVSGTGFTSTSTVTFGGLAASGVIVNSATQLTAISPAHAAGTVGLVVTNDAGGSAPSPFTYYATTDVTGIAPTSGPEAGGTTVTITGTAFTGATGVTFGGTPAASFTVVSGTQITAVTPAGTGAVDVTVTVPGEAGADTLPGAFTYRPAPAVASLSPNRGPIAGGTVVTLSGTDFDGATSVTFDGIAGTAFTVDSATQITVTSPAHAAGAVPVVITDPDGSSVPVTFTYFATTDVTAVSPTRGPVAGGTTVTITGTAFSGATSVTFGTTPAASFTVVSDTQISAMTPAGTGTVGVTVAVPGEAGTDTLPAAFTYRPAPAVASLAPNRGPVAGGTAVTITGTDLDGATSVTFDGTAGTAFTVDSPTQITVTSPAHAAGAVPVVITNPIGDSAPVTFTYFATTDVTGAAPTRGPVAGGTNVTITGTAFTGATSVTFGTTPAASFSVNSDTQITAVTPAGTGTVGITVGVPGEAGSDTLPGAFTYYATTDVTGISPTSGPGAGGTTVTITGTAFTGTTSVTLGTTPAASFTVNSDTQITAVTPAGTGTVGVTVTVPGEAGSDTLAGAFTYRPAPAVASLTPNRGPIAGGTVVTLSGTDFDGAISVTFDGIAGTAFTVDSATQITVTTPAHAAGAVPVVITDPDGNSVPVTFTYYATTDATGINPTSGPQAGGTTVTITGTAFTGATSVAFGTTPAGSFTVVSDTQITAVTPAGTGTVGVTVTGPGDAGSDTLAGAFTYVAPGAPTVSTVNPTSGSTAGGTVVAITGTGFTGATGATFDGIPGTAFVVNSPTRITVTSPARSAGTVGVVITSGAGTSNPGQFTYVAPTAPTVTGLDPSGGPAAGGTTVTITGTGFTGTTAVTFGGTPATNVMVVSDTVITATSPAHAAGTVGVVVQTPAGASFPSAFTYAPAPAVTGIDPATGPTAGGTTVTLTGAGFTGSTGVTFDGLAATSVTVVSDTQLRVVSPAHPAGTVDVIVQSPNGPSDAVDYGYLDIPVPGGAVITGVDPARGPIGGGTLVTITGTGFTGATSASFGANDGLLFSVVSDTQITVFAPAHAAGTVPLIVRAPAGASDPAVFTYYGTTITGVSPAGGPRVGGVNVTISGSCFTDAQAVRFGAADAAFRVVDDNTIIATTPAQGVGDVPVSVVGSPVCGSGTLPLAFEYTAGTAGAGAGAGGDGSPRSLAYTGADPSMAAGIALLLMLLGAAAVLRRRRA